MGKTTVLFVAALSEFDQALFEDEAQNRVKEAMALFADTCNNAKARVKMCVLLKRSARFSRNGVLHCCIDFYLQHNMINTLPPPRSGSVRVI